LLGIDYEVAYFTDNLQTPQGNFAWNNDTAIRNYFKQYQAVLVGFEVSNLTFQSIRQRAFRWLSWNDSDDPPVFYLGVYPRSGNPDFTTPADFPIILPDPSNPSATSFSYAMGGNFRSTANLRVRLHRESQELYTSAANFLLSSTGPAALYLLDMAKHTALGSQGEILATPVSEDISFPPNAVLAYRYKNRYLMPIGGHQHSSWLNSEPMNGPFWVFYALKLAGITPRYRLPLFLVMDDALMLYFMPAGNPAGVPTFAQFARIGYETYRYLAEEFYPRTGCPMICGLLTGGRYRSNYSEHWKLVREQQWNSQPLDSETHNYILQWHDLLVRYHQSALPCTIHDHSIELRANRTHSNFVRHSDTGFPHAAPNDVPITRGNTVIRASAYTGTVPAGARERIIDGERYYEWNFSAASGTGTTISSITPNNIYAARLMWETAVAEMRALGFPDAHGGEENRLLISPNGFTGDVPVWRALREIGYQAVRMSPRRSVHTPPDTNPVSFVRAFEGLHFLGTLHMDFAQSFDITLGLFYPGYPNHSAVGYYGADVSGDVSDIWNTDRPTAARRAYRRIIGAVSNLWLQSVFGERVMMTHPNVCLGWADPADPTRPFDPNDPRVSINFLLEVAWNMEKIVNVLYPYLKFGTVKEYVAMRERVLAE